MKKRTESRNSLKARKVRNCEKKKQTEDEKLPNRDAEKTSQKAHKHNLKMRI